MPVKVFHEEELVELLKDEVVDPELKQPQRCRRCNRVLIYKIEDGHLVQICLKCDGGLGPFGL